MTVDLVLGVCLHIGGCIGTSFGLCMQKRAHNRMEGSDLPYYKNMGWAFGLVVGFNFHDP
jgi:hypothetical protein